ncbi:MAG: TlpA family protein disulfide reductase [Chitinophagales bacterium]|nr:TlpA family protein disulfide reductase [Chitinophagales bacterium]
MKKIQLLAIIFSLSFVASSQNIKSVKINDIVNIIDISSAPTVINFWATWCGPCVAEIPWFEKLIDEMKDKNIQLILVSLDFKTAYPKDVTNFVIKKKYKSTIFWLNETDASFYCPLIDKDWNGNIPVTIMVNNKKKYKQFYDSQLPEARLKLELQKLVE